MPVKYDDENCYRFHTKDSPDRCFVYSDNSSRLLVVRQMESMMLVHLCPDCMVKDTASYLLDNTRPWLGEKGKL